MSEGKRLAAAASELIGVPFKLHGQNPAFGLDCVGLLVASLNAIGRCPIAPRGYRLRNATIQEWLKNAAQSGLTETEGVIIPGDVMLSAPGPAQHHLMIAANAGQVIHAHAGLRRVVVQPLSAQITLLKHWRLSRENKDT